MTTVHQATDSRVADLVRAGKVRVALYLPQYTKDAVTGELRGWCVDLVRALGAHIGIVGLPVEHDTPPLAMASLKSGACDAGILGIDPSRTAVVDYSPPVVEADFTCLVPAGSSIRNIADADRPGIRIAVVRNHASTLALSRILKHASLVYADTLEPAFEIMRRGEADVFASLREMVIRCSAQLPGSRVLEERYGFNSLAMAVAKGEVGRRAYLSEFIEQAKSSGLVQQIIDRGDWRGVRVAPPEKSS